MNFKIELKMVLKKLKPVLKETKENEFKSVEDGLEEELR